MTKRKEDCVQEYLVPDLRSPMTLKEQHMLWKPPHQGSDWVLFN